MELSETNGLDTISSTADWKTISFYYPSGRKKEQFRVLIPNGSELKKDRLNYSLQHQVYDDNDEGTIILKEGKYARVAKGKMVYSYYGWWYDNTGKMYRRIREKRTRKI